MASRAIRARPGATVYAYRGDHVILTGPATVYACRVPVDHVRMLPRDLTQFRCQQATVTKAITAQLA